MMDLTLLISFVTMSLFPGYGLSCKTDDAFESECMTPYNKYQTTDFWTNICSDQGKLVYSCILAQNNCPTENAVQTTFLEKFKARFDPYKMNIGFACEYQHTVCQGVTLCVPSSIYGFQGVTVYDFYKYFCGPEVSLRTMFTCLADLQPSCPVTVEQFSTYKLNTPSGLLSYTSLATNTLAECAKIGDQDVQCIQSKVDDIAQCGIISTINMTFLTMNCQYNSKTKACVSEKCGASVATFYDAMYTFLSCFLNNGEWSAWTGWSTCTLTCGQGITLRTRDCSIGPISGEQVCEGESTEIKDCTITECPVDGQFGFWGYWSECNQNCGGGSRTRTRSCNNPTPANGGKDCEGDKSQSEFCNEQQCAGKYGLWSVWSTCSKSCGQGSQSRTRTCEGGGSCSGPSSESKDCTVQECPGEYGPWSDWSTCSTSCGKGSQSRTRTCEGGSSCSGPSSESKDCIVQECHVDGAFSDWEVWTICSKTCGGGIRTRARTCSNPSPAFGGKECDGSYKQSETCNGLTCRVKKCLAETNKYGSWPETDPGVTVDLGCKKQEEKGSYSRRCGSDGSWEEVTGACEIDPEVLNEIDEELQGLANSDEDISEDLENILNNLTELTGTVDGDTSVTSMTRLVGTAQSVVDVIESSKTVTEQGTKEFLQLMDDVIKPETEETWQKSDADGSDILNMVERYVSVVHDVKCGTIDDGTVTEYSNDNMYTEIGKSDAGVKFPSKIQADNSIEIPAASLASKGITDTCFGGTSFKSIGNLINGGSSSDGSVESVDTSQVVNSEIVSAILPQKSGVSYTNLDPPVVVTFKPKNKTFTKPVCVFWDFNALGPGQKGAWSTDGCSLKEETADNVVCQCSHLTNFAVLMSPSGVDSKHSQILSIISAVGCAISMVCLILTIVAHAVVWRLVRSDRAIVLMNLCVALFVALGMFLAGVNRTESRKACAAIAAIIQYLFLAVFFFMLLIGIEILICVVHVFVTKFRIKVLLPVAWVVPAVIVGISLGVTKAEGYGNDKFCWLDIESGLIWSFIGPAAFIICINFIIILIVFKKMASSAVLKSKTSSIKIKTGLRSLCVLLPLMGLTWVFGILSVNSSMFFLQYLFCIFNTLQGLFIFLFHCVFNRQIREAIKRRQERKKSLQTLSSDLRKQSRSVSKDEKRRKSGDRRTSDIKQNGIGNKAFTGKDERELSKDYDADDWDKVERKMYHKNIRRGSKLWR